MARQLAHGDTVYVPCSRLDGIGDIGTALYRTRVEGVQGKRVTVSLPGGKVSKPIGMSLLHRDVGILVLNIGDFETERTLLDPLAKSVAQFCRLLVPDDQILSVRVRSLGELKQVWIKEQAVYTHVIWIGHGSKDGLRFAVDGLISADQLCEELRVTGAPKKTYVSLCCKTGFSSFGGTMSRAKICDSFVGPFHSVEGAVASQFCQTFLTCHFLSGETTGVSFNHARKWVPGGASFRLWSSGKLKAGAKA